jgi:hypothetical protein
LFNSFTMKNLLFHLFFFLFLLHIKSYSQSLQINEFGARNSSVVYDINNEYDDWIEIHNISGESINLNGYYLTDDLQDNTKCRLVAAGGELTVPPDGFIILWADNETTEGTNHLNFKLSGDEGQIGIFSPDVKLTDTITYQSQYTDISMGRDISINSQWKFYPSPTPGSSNSSAAFNGVTGKPVFNKHTGLYTNSFQVTITPSNTGDVIKYTLNKADPVSTSPTYSGPLSVNKTQVIRAVGHKTGNLNSSIISHIYFENVSHSLPVLAIITDTLNLWGTDGIYDNPGMAGPDWERFCQIKYLKDELPVKESNAGIRIQGASSVYMPKKSFRLFFKETYGDGNFNYPVYGTDQISSFEKLVLKSGYDDDITTETGTLLRDALSAEMWRRTGGLSNMSAWAALYLNERYWGIYNIRESVDEHFIHDHTDLTNFDLIRFKNEGAFCEFGTIDAWNTLFTFIDGNDFSLDENFRQAETMMDMDDFISLMAFVQCSEYYSWSWGASMYRENTSTAKWKSTIWDTDRAYSDVYWNGFEEAQYTESLYWANHFPKRFMQNAGFNRRFVNRICDLLNSAFKPENAVAALDSIYLIIKPEMPAELDRWNPSNTNWETNVENVREFLRNRPEILKNQIEQYFSLSNMHTITLDVNGNGIIKVNALLIDQYPWQGDYFENNLFEIKAIPLPGYLFAGWDGIETNPVSTKPVNLASDTSFTAYFVPGVYGLETPVNNSESISAFPNPFTSETNISFYVENTGQVEIAVYNNNGQLVEELYRGISEQGEHTISWNNGLQSNRQLQPGVYYLMFKTGQTSGCIKMVCVQ